LAEQGEITTLNRAQAVHFGDVGTGDERFGTGAGQHHHPHRRVGSGLGEGRIQGFQRRPVEGVEFVRAIDRHSAYGTIVHNRDKGVGHGRTPENVKKK